jgi:hypothetical protein
MVSRIRSYELVVVDPTQPASPAPLVATPLLLLKLPFPLAPVVALALTASILPCPFEASPLPSSV